MLSSCTIISKKNASLPSPCGSDEHKLAGRGFTDSSSDRTSSNNMHGFLLHCDSAENYIINTTCEAEIFAGDQCVETHRFRQNSADYLKNSVKVLPGSGISSHWPSPVLCKPKDNTLLHM